MITNVISEAPRPPENIVLPKPQPLDLLEVQWTVLTAETLPEGEEWVYFGVDTQGYENLSLNMAEILDWIYQANWRLDIYAGDTPETLLEEDILDERSE